MYKLCRINLKQRDQTYQAIKQFATLLKDRYGVKKVYLFGSFATGRINEGSDIDLIIVGKFQGKMPQRIKQILDLTSLPIEPLVYTEAEFD